MHQVIGLITSTDSKYNGVWAEMTATTTIGGSGWMTVIDKEELFFFDNDVTVFNHAELVNVLNDYSNRIDHPLDCDCDRCQAAEKEIDQKLKDYTGLWADDELCLAGDEYDMLDADCQCSWCRGVAEEYRND